MEDILGEINPVGLSIAIAIVDVPLNNIISVVPLKMFYICHAS